MGGPNGLMTHYTGAERKTTEWSVIKKHHSATSAEPNIYDDVDGNERRVKAFWQSAWVWETDGRVNRIA